MVCYLITADIESNMSWSLDEKNKRIKHVKSHVPIIDPMLLFTSF